ncbi:MAG: tRNA lysidine(34) synthetase TilS [Flavobacteriales bacterium]|nr:tRNA lysidine(34) synthetase TilS [Flavobacteriales bacterium]
MLTLKTFETALRNLHNNNPLSSYLLAVSGGADSMVLLHLFTGLKLHFEVAHVNYKLRGKDSEDDRETVENFCVENNISFHVYEVSEKDKQPENSIQNWARNLRYTFFRKVQEERKLQYLVTAHHLNDQLETFIINLSKAAGIKGLSGMPANDNHILRPLLQFSKDQIYAFAEEHHINFREDLSNKKNDYLRNFIRNEIAPKLLETNDHFLENFAKSLTYLNQVKTFAEEKIEEFERQIISEKENLILIQKAEFLKQPVFVKFEILKKFSFDDEKEFPKIFTAEKGKVFHAPDFKLMVDREYFVLNKKTGEKSDLPNSDDEIIVAESLDTIKDHTFSLSQFISPENDASSDLKWIFDGEKLQFPLKLRKKKTGDLFFPIGLIGKKTISKFFKDEKIPILAQQKIWLLCDGIDNVLGIIPFRQDRRFAAEVNSKSKITITF